MGFNSGFKGLKCALHKNDKFSGAPKETPTSSLGSPYEFCHPSITHLFST